MQCTLASLVLFKLVVLVLPGASSQDLFIVVLLGKQV